MNFTAIHLLPDGANGAFQGVNGHSKVLQSLPLSPFSVVTFKLATCCLPVLVTYMTSFGVSSHHLAALSYRPIYCSCDLGHKESNGCGSRALLPADLLLM